MPACFLTMALFMFTIPAVCQSISSQLLTAAGSTFANDSYQVDWSLGELAIDTYSTGSTILSQGFQQGGISLTTGTGALSSSQISLYPNPAHDQLLLRLGDDMTSATYEGQLTAILSDINGRVLKIEEITKNDQKIHIEDIEPGTYLFFIRKNKVLVRTFKIIKI